MYASLLALSLSLAPADATDAVAAKSTLPAIVLEDRLTADLDSESAFVRRGGFNRGYPGFYGRPYGSFYRPYGYGFNPYYRPYQNFRPFGGYGYGGYYGGWRRW